MRGVRSAHFLAAARAARMRRWTSRLPVDEWPACRRGAAARGADALRLHGHHGEAADRALRGAAADVGALPVQPACRRHRAAPGHGAPALAVADALAAGGAQPAAGGEQLALLQRPLATAADRLHGDRLRLAAD